MSCFILSNDHIGYLVNLGYQLDIRGVTIGDCHQSLALYDEHDRRYVTAELIAATSGLGFMVQSAAQFLVTDVVVLGILVIALIAFAMEMGLRALQRKLVPWHGQAH